MKVFIILIFIYSSLYSTQRLPDINNLYSVEGRFTYNDVLQKIGRKSKRSVIGSSELLELERTWHIVNKDFFKTVEACRKNAYSDGHSLYVTQDYIFVIPLDTLEEKKVTSKDTLYEYLSPWTGVWHSTEDITEYKNFRHFDSLQYFKEEVPVPEKKFLELEIEIAGFTDVFLSDNGLTSTGGITFSAPKQSINEGSKFLLFASLPSIQLQLGKIDSKYNFYRKMKIQIPADTLVNVRFGSESRREQGKSVTDGGTVSTVYESVYNGLSLEIKDSVYTAYYRILDTELTLKGLGGYLSTASAKIENKETNYLFKKKRFRIPRKRSINNTNFNIEMRVQIKAL